MAKKRRRSKKASLAASGKTPAPAAKRAKAAGRAGARAPARLSRRERSLAIADHMPTWYMWLLAAFVALPAIVSPYGHEYGYSPDLHMAAYLQVGVPAMIAVLLFWHASTRGIALLQSRIVGLLFAFWAWSMLSVLWAHNFFEALVKGLDYTAAVFGGALVAQTITRRRHMLHWLVVALFWSGVALALLGIAQFLFDVQWVDQHARPSATFNNKNMAAQYGLLTLPLGAMLFLRAESQSSRWIYSIGSATIMVFITYTRTRAAWLSLLLECAVLAAFIWHERRCGRLPALTSPDVLRPAALAGLLWLLGIHFDEHGFRWFLSFAAQVVVDTADSVKLDGTGIPRIAIWSNTLAMILENPFGVGLGNWVVQYPMYHTRVIPDYEMSEAIQHINVHNDYLEFAAELGVFGAALLVWVAWRVFKVASRIWAWSDHSPNGPDRLLLIGVLTATAGLCFDAIFSFPFQQPVPLFLTVVYLCIFAAYEARADGEAEAVDAPAKILAVVSHRGVLASAGALAGALSVAALLLHIRWYDSEVEFRKATISSQRGQDYRMLLSGKRAYALNPLRDRLQNFVAMGHMRRGETQQAVIAFERVLSGYPHLIHTLNNAALAYMRSERYPDAVRVLRHLVTIRPHSYKGHKNLGVLLMNHLGQPREALPHFRQALALEPDSPQADALREAIVHLEALPAEGAGSPGALGAGAAPADAAPSAIPST